MENTETKDETVVVEDTGRTYSQFGNDVPVEAGGDDSDIIAKETFDN